MTTSMWQRLLGNPVHVDTTWSEKDLTFASTDPDPEDKGMLGPCVMDKQFAFCFQLLVAIVSQLSKRMQLTELERFTHKLFFYRGDVASLFVKTKDWKKHLFYYV